MERRATEPPETSAIHEGDGSECSGRSGIYKIESMNDGLHLVLLILARFDQELERTAVLCGMQGTPKPVAVLWYRTIAEPLIDVIRRPLASCVGNG